MHSRVELVSRSYWFDRRHAKAPHAFGLPRACDERPVAIDTGEAVMG